MSKHGKLWAMVAVLMLAFGLRVWLLADTNYNWDEGYSAWISRLPLPELFDTTARDVHPPLYYLLLRGTRALLSDGEFTLRFLSVALGVWTVALTYRLGRTVGGAWVGVGAAVLMALARSNVHISQLARMHVLTALLATGALWAVVCLWRNFRDWRAMVAYVACTAAALYTFYLGVVLPLAANAAFVVVWVSHARVGRGFGGVSRGRALWTWVGLQVVAAGLFLPWASYAAARMFGWSSDAATPPGFFTQFYASTLTVGRPTFDTGQLPYVLAYLLAVAVGVGMLAWRGRALEPSAAARRRDLLLLMAAGVLMPAVIVFLLALPFHELGRPLAARYMTPLGASFYVLAAWGAMGIARWRRAGGIAALAVMVGVAGWGMSNIADRAIRRDETHAVALMLEAMRRPEDAVLYHNDRTWTSLAAHYPGEVTLIRQGQQMTAEYTDYLLDPIREDTEAIWLVQTPDTANDPEGNVEAWLERKSERVGSWTLNDHAVSLYARTPERAELARDLASEADVPDAWANPDIGLAGVERPLRRYPIGDRMSVALYWDTPPDTLVMLALVPLDGGEPIIVEVAPPVAATDGVTRQQVSVPLLATYAPGRYTLELRTGGTVADLGPVWLVRFADAAALNADAIGTTVEATFRAPETNDPLITLLGYTLPSDIVAGGDELEVTLYWQAEDAITTSYKVSVFLQREPSAPLVAQVDAEPVNWTFPTTLWQPGVPLADPYKVPVGVDVPPWTYTLSVVLYDPATGDRLLTGTPSNALPLEPIVVE